MAYACHSQRQDSLRCLVTELHCTHSLADAHTSCCISSRSSRRIHTYLPLDAVICLAGTGVMAGWTVCMLLLLCTYQATAATANLAAQPSNAQQYGAAADSINISIESAANPADDDPNQKTVPSLALRHMSRRQRLISSPVPAPPATPTAVRNSSRTRQGTFKPRGGPARPGRRRGYLPSARSTAAAVVASAAQYAGSAVPRVPLELIRGMARPALNPDTVMFAAVYQQQGEGDAAAHAAAAASSDLSTASICSGDPALKPTVNSRTTCRLFVNTGDWLVPCTAWFVSQTHMVTAGRATGISVILICVHQVLVQSVLGYCIEALQPQTYMSRRSLSTQVCMKLSVWQ